MNKFFEFAKEHPFVAFVMVSSATNMVVETVRAVVSVFKKNKNEAKETPVVEATVEVKETAEDTKENTESEK